MNSAVQETGEEIRLTHWQQQIARWIRTAYFMEVMSPKPGNVCPNAEFPGASVSDFLRSAEAIAPEMALAETRPLGESILKAVEATRSVVSHNTNLGIILLIGLFGFAWQKRIFPRGFWKIFFPISAGLYFLQLAIAVPILLQQHSPAGYLILASDFMLYGANFCYVYRSKMSSGRIHDL